MKKLILGAVVSAGLFAVMPFASAAGDAKAGEKLSASCTACHGADGNSMSAMFPKLAGLGDKYIYKQLKDIADTDSENPARVVPEMKGMLDGMSDKDFQDLAAYYHSKNMRLAGAKKIEVKLNSGRSLNSDESLKLGEKIYRAGNPATGVAACTACHSPTGKGNAPAGYPRVGGQHADYIEKQLEAFKGGERTNDSAAVMRDIAGKMSAAEIKAVANYIAGLTE